MGQLRTGTASVTNGSASVTITGVASGAEEVAVGSAFKRDNEAAIYTIASRTPSSGASLTALTLTAPYAGTTGAGLLYQITSDFTPGRNYPELSQGDGDAADWITKALRMIDTDYGSLIAAFPLTPGSAGGIAYATGTALAWTGAGTAGYVLTSGGAGAPFWAANIAGKSGSTDALRSATTTINVAAAAAPTAGQVLTATDGTHATWVTPAPTGMTSLNGLTDAAQTFSNDTNITITSATGVHTLGWTGTLAIARGGTGNANGYAVSTNALQSASTTVNVAAATAPTAGQVLTATDGTHATWQTPSSSTLENTYFLQGKTSAGVAKRLIGVTASNFVQIDADGLAILAGSSGGKQITSADGTLRANGTGVATGRILYANSSAEMIASANLFFDATGLSIGNGGAGSFLLDANGKGRFDRVLIGTAGSPTIHGSFGYVTNGQVGITAAYAIQLKANIYGTADAALSNVGAYNAYHVIIPAQDSTSIGLGIRAAVAQTAALLRAENSAGTALFDITGAGALKLYGSTSGSVSLAAPAVAGTQNYTLPSSYGSNGQLLTSDGAGGMSWTTVSAGGSGTVNSGTAGQLAYYATTGTAVSGLATPAAGQVLTSGAAPAWSASPSLTGLTLSSLTAGGYILYADGAKNLVNSTAMYFSAASGRIELFHALNTSTTTGIIDITSNNNSGLGLHVATPGTTAAQYAVRINSTAFRDDLVVMASGRIGIGASYAAGTFTELVNVKNASYIGGINAAGTATRKLIGLNASDQVVLSGDGQDIRWGRALVALGGGAAPTLGTIGGSGPATATQDSWMRVIDSAGNAFWVPVWK